MREYKNFELMVRFWMKELEKYNEEPFKKKPGEKSWSLGELYIHLYVSGLFYLENVEHCMEKIAGQQGGSKNLRGMVTFFQKSFLPVKYKLGVNDKNPPVMPESIMEVKDKLIKLLKLMYDVGKKMERFTKEDLKYKTKSHAFGYLNAMEWYMLSEMHFRHHIKQKDRLEKFISTR